MNLKIWVVFFLSIPLLSSQNLSYDSFAEFEKNHLTKQNDTTYLYNFWATWCKPCVEELPHFIELADKYKEGPYRFIFVSLDSKKNTSKLQSFVEKNLKNQYVIQLSDTKYNNWIDKVDPAWSGSIPATLLTKNSKKEFYEQQFDNFIDLHTIWLTFLKI